MTRGLRNPFIRLLGLGLIVDGVRRIVPRSTPRSAVGSLTSPLPAPLRVLEVGLGLVILERAPITPGTLYRYLAPVYDRLTPLWRDWLYRHASSVLDDALRASCPTGGRVLDLGCGTGAVLERLRAVGAPLASYTGVDQSWPMLDRAQAQLGAVPGVRFERLDLRTDALPAGPFDLITSAWALEHLPEPGRVLATAAGRLRPEGRLVVLFEADGDTWRERVLRRVWRFFGARLVPEREYSAWPGRISVRRFSAAGPAVVVMISSPGAK